MDYSKIEKLEELRKFGEVNTQNPGLAILTLQNGDEYYFFYNEQEGSVELIKELNSVKDSKTKTYMHRPTRKEGYAFTVDSNIGAPNDKDITRTRYIIILDKKRVVQMFQTNRPSPEPDGLLYHWFFYDDKGQSLRFYVPEEDKICSTFQPHNGIVFETPQHIVKTVERLEYKKNTDSFLRQGGIGYMVIIPKDKNDTSTVAEIVSTHELRQFYDTTTDKDLKKFLEGNFSKFKNVYLQGINMAEFTDLQTIYDRSQSVDKDSIPGILIATSFEPVNSNNKNKSFYLLDENGNPKFLGREEKDNNIRCNIFRRDNSNYIYFQSRLIRNGESPDLINNTIAFLDTRKILKIDGKFSPNNPQTYRCFKSITRFGLVDDNGIIHYGKKRGVEETFWDDAKGKRLPVENVDVTCEEGLYMVTLYGEDSSAIDIACLKDETVYAAYRGPYGKEIVEFLNGDEFRDFLTEERVDLFIDNFARCTVSEQTRRATDCFDRASRLFNPTFMKGNYIPKSQEEIDRLAKDAHVAALRRKLNDQKRAVKETREELRKLGVEPGEEEK